MEIENMLPQKQDDLPLSSCNIFEILSDIPYLVDNMHASKMYFFQHAQ